MGALGCGTALGPAGGAEEAACLTGRLFFCGEEDVLKYLDMGGDEVLSSGLFLDPGVTVPGLWGLLGTLAWNGSTDLDPGVTYSDFWGLLGNLDWNGFTDPNFDPAAPLA